MIYSELTHIIETELPFEPTSEQHEALMAISKFIISSKVDSAFILRGYAGTGKTSIISALVCTLSKIARPVVLLAPTGRAAKVFTHYSGKSAYTIHKTIYRQKKFEGENSNFSLGYNKLTNALFIVDESSMISNQGVSTSLFGTGLLLDDLIKYVFEGNGCKLLFVGDTAQLPPVGEDKSPALSSEVLCEYGLRISQFDLTSVVRQAAESGVLWNATCIRQLIQNEAYTIPQIKINDFADIKIIPGGELIETLEMAYSNFGSDDTIIVTRSNKRANIYNNGIRNRIFDREEELTRGDLVMTVKNNYYWAEQEMKNLEEDAQLPFSFIANGDTAEIVRINNVHEMHGFHFADATLRFHDYNDFEISCRIILDTLQSDAPALTHEQNEQLYQRVLEDYADIKSKKKRLEMIRKDPYFNAIQIKYAYAITCHKAQGGQWSQVFIDQGFIREQDMDFSYYRWLYTAFTRTTQQLYLVNWPQEQTL